MYSAPKLSPRQLQVLQLAANGKNNIEIAKELDLSIHTVKRHFGILYNKIITNGSCGQTGSPGREIFRAEAVAWGFRRGVIK